MTYGGRAPYRSTVREAVPLELARRRADFVRAYCIAKRWATDAARLSLVQLDEITKHPEYPRA